MTEDIEKFDKRAATYTAARVSLFDLANQQAPQARRRERECMITRLQLQRDMRFCDVSAGSGYLSDGVFEQLSGEVDITCVENSDAFVDLLRGKHRVVKSSLTDIRLADRAFDRVGCLVGIHHQENKRAFFEEAFRLLDHGGRLVVGDVLEGSPPALFLNNAVDQYSDLGHDGMFLREGDVAQQLEDVGFTNVTEELEHYTWSFVDEPSMVSYCRNLFRMTKATLDEVAQSIDQYLTVSYDSDGCHFEWQLLFLTAEKPARSLVV